ncbi:40S ribosomal protein S5-1 [Hordeum vulgare]|nr:40S ribosomal protein S5-1 [Hordeum vulgare]
MLHIRDVEGPKKTGSMETRLEAMEKQVFKCQGMVERGLNANHMMITEFTSNHKMDAIDIGKHLSRLYDRVDQLQGQIYDLQNQNCEYEYRFKSISTSVVGYASCAGYSYCASYTGSVDSSCCAGYYFTGHDRYASYNNKSGYAKSRVMSS